MSCMCHIGKGYRVYHTNHHTISFFLWHTSGTYPHTTLAATTYPVWTTAPQHQLNPHVCCDNTMHHNGNSKAQLQKLRTSNKSGPFHAKDQPVSAHHFFFLSRWLHVLMLTPDHAYSGTLSKEQQTCHMIMPLSVASLFLFFLFFFFSLFQLAY